MKNRIRIQDLHAAAGRTIPQGVPQVLAEDLSHTEWAGCQAAREGDTFDITFYRSALADLIETWALGPGVPGYEEALDVAAAIDAAAADS